MGVGLVRSLQPPDILLIHWRVYNSIANTSKRVLFLPLSDVYVRSFLYLLYTLIKLYYTKSLSDQASSLAPDWILLLWRPRIQSFVLQQQPFNRTDLKTVYWIWPYGEHFTPHLVWNPRQNIPSYHGNSFRSWFPWHHHTSDFPSIFLASLAKAYFLSPFLLNFISHSTLSLLGTSLIVMD